MTSIFNLAPELSTKMDNILQRYEEFHKKTYGEEMMAENTAVNMNAYKDAINNAVSPKKNSAKNKVEQLVRK
jgi:activator of HSP90 ATPase